MNNKLYIAGSINDVDEIKQFMQLLESKGYIITENWTQHKLITHGQQDAKNNLKGIDDCDVFIMYLTNTKSSGKMFEFGYAEALMKPILIFGNQLHATSIYYMLGAALFSDTIFELLNDLESL
jgi:nucleoside 2-deoxyribosyltransferase